MSLPSRMDQVDGVIGAAVSKLLDRHRRPGVIATVTNVQTSPDLSHSAVWISLIPDADEYWQAIEEILPEVQTDLGGKLTMKRTPKLTFRRDQSGDRADRITRLLNKVRDDS